MNIMELLAKHTKTLPNLLKDTAYTQGMIYIVGERYKIKRTSLFLKEQDMQTGAVRVKRMLPEIPSAVYKQIKYFFKTVWKAENTEASCMVFHGKIHAEVPAEYEEDAKYFLHRIGQWYIYIPKQQNSYGLTNFQEDTFHEWLRQHSTLVAECHSHHAMSAFWSDTDNSHQHEFIYYIVCGGFNNKTEDEEIKVKYVVNGKRVGVPPTDLIADYRTERAMNLHPMKPPKNQRAWLARAKGLM